MSGTDWLEPEARDELRALLRAEALRPAPQGAHALLGALRERYGEAVLGAIFYGSCRRDVDAREGVLDLHLVLRSLRPALAPAAAAACAVLPPNVGYLEAEGADGRVRGKVALLSLAQLRRGCSRRAVHSYLWGRYAQPVTLLGFDDPEPLVDALLEALATFAWRTLPLIDARRAAARTETTAAAAATARTETGDEAALAYWRLALAQSYASELRPEGPGRAATLVALEAEHYRRTGALLLSQRGRVTRSRARTRLAWWCRRGLGKGLSLVRLVKAAWTFEGGVDYALYKLERHGAPRLEVSERVRRWPLLFGWPLLWRLWRSRALR